MRINSDTRPLLSLEEVTEKPVSLCQGCQARLWVGLGPADPEGLSSRVQRPRQKLPLRLQPPLCSERERHGKLGLRRGQDSLCCHSLQRPLPEH